jgi:hypothetical protein
MHLPECDALFERLGWDSYEQYIVSMGEGLERCTDGPT